MLQAERAVLEAVALLADRDEARIKATIDRFGEDVTIEYIKTTGRLPFLESHITARQLHILHPDIVPIDSLFSFVESSGNEEGNPYE